MNIQTVAENLRVTIAGKEKMLATLQQRVSIERTPIDQTAFVAAINFLEINIDELKRVLQDVEQCESSLSGAGNNYENGIVTTETEYKRLKMTEVCYNSF
jgi:exonuclease VII small subunit